MAKVWLVRLDNEHQELKVGDEFEVEELTVFGWSSYYTFKNMPGHYNTMDFEPDWEDIYQEGNVEKKSDSHHVVIFN